MSAKSSPFVRKELPCPACGHTHPQRFFRQRMFIPEEKESDQHVVTYKWLSKSAKPVHPPLYFVFYCPKCHYADAAPDFSKPTESEYTLFVVRQFRKLKLQDNPPIEHLAQSFDYDQIDFVAALALHLLAISIQQIAPEDMCDHYKIGRLLLRVAWLYRETGVSEHAKTPETQDSGNGLKETQKCAQVDAAKMQQRIREFGLRLEKTKQAWETLAETLRGRPGTFPSGDDPDRYEACRSKMDELMAAQAGVVSELEVLARPDAENRAAPASLSAAPQYAPLLDGLRPLWAETPCTEQDAMRLAADYFMKALWKDLRFGSGQARYNLIALVTDLYIRCRDLDSAYNMLAGLYKSNMDAIRQYEHALKDQATTEERRKRIPGLIKRTQSALESTAELRRNIINMLMERDRPKIDALLEQYADASPEERLAALEQNGIVAELIARLKRPGGPLEVLAKRKFRR